MNRRALLFGLLALTLGLTGAYLNHEWLSSQTPTFDASAPVTKVAIAAAKTELKIGEAIRDLQTTTVEWPAGLLPQGSFTRLADVEGRIPRRPLVEGELILESALLPIGSDGGLTPMIAEGKRAVAVKVDEVIGIAGFVKPGARVDVLATIGSRGRSAGTFSKVILQDMKVLAIDQTLEESTAGEPMPVSVVTLEVDPKQAQQLIFAAHEGRLQLALRNPADGAVVRTSSVSASSLRGYAPKRAARQTQNVEVIKGLKVSTRKF